MSKTRFTPWVVLACIGTLAGCTSGEGGTAGNTDLNIVLPNGCLQDTTAPECFDIQVVEYTIACDDGDPTPNGPFLDNGAGFDDRVVINGVLEVFDTPQPGRDGRAASGDPWTWGSTLGDIYVAQGFMDLPVTQDCKAQLRARTAPTSDNPDGEVICSDTVTFGVEADKVSTVNVLMRCGLSFQAPVAQLDLAGDFSFNVSNFCPDLFVLNCLDSNPTEPEGAASTTCQVRFRDGDNQCGNSCDPQVCTEAPEGLRCEPACEADSSCPTEPTTVVSCGGAAMDCDGLGGADDTSCTFTGNTTGTPILTGIDEGSFNVNCGLSAAGATVTCTAVTTDGDRDCDKTKVVTVDCPGLAPCDEPTAPVCDGSTEVHPECVAGVCDDSSGTAVCVYTPITSVPDDTGLDCNTNPDTALNGKCDSANGGICVDFGCTFGDDTTCEDTATQCLTAPVGACQADGTCQAEVPEDAGTSCDIGAGADSGQCDGVADNCVSNCSATSCDDGNECTLDDCNPTGASGAVCPDFPSTTCCSNDAAAANGDPCNFGAGNCSNGACVTPVETCVRFAPVPVDSTVQGVCEKREFIAIDCQLLGNSAPLPLNASAQAVDIDNFCSVSTTIPCQSDASCPGGETCVFGALTDIAFAGVPIGVYIQDAFVLPADLVCGFIGAGFSQSGLGNSLLANDISNADITSALVASFLDDPATTTDPNLLSPHPAVIFNFGTACGDDCVNLVGTNGECASNSAVSCSPVTFTDDCSVENGGAVGTGPGIFAPFLFNPTPPGVIVVDTTTGELTPLVPPVVLTPLSQGSVDFTLNYDETTILLPQLVGDITTNACVGAACGSGLPLPNNGQCIGGLIEGTPCAVDDDCGAPPAVCRKDVCAAETFNGVCNLSGTCRIGDSGGQTAGVCSNEIKTCTIDDDCIDPDDGTCAGAGNIACTSDAQCPDIAGPRVMYEATCDKIEFAACGGTACTTTADCPLNSAAIGGTLPGQTCDAGLCTNVNSNTCGLGGADLCPDTVTDCSANGDDDCDAFLASQGIPTCCAPFGIYPDVADACKGASVDAAGLANLTDCCDIGVFVPPTGGGDTIRPFDPGCNVNPDNRRRCCIQYQEDYPTATSAQQPQLWVNP